MTFADALPMRARYIRGAGNLCVGDNGRFLMAPDALISRLARDEIRQGDLPPLRRAGLAIEPDDPLGHNAHIFNIAERLTQAGPLDYLILVPTLRCNLSCSYCQVSRVQEKARGFDWSNETLEAVLALIDRLPGDSIKIEFQGGEPTLRPDLIQAVIDRCERFTEKQFVICTNLQTVSPEILALFDRDDLYISTSLDGDPATHLRNRTGNAQVTEGFLTNLAMLIGRYGHRKISALPTIDPRNPPSIDDLIDTYAGFGLDSIFLRPINYQGFARKRHKDAREQDDAWRSYHERFVRAIIARNWADRERVIEETYFSICLRRVFQPGRDRHVDLRNPNPMGVDYVVVDHDGTVFPTDEARMLSRSGVVDLAIGDVFNGWETEQRDLLNHAATNQFDPACQRCAYQPYCGRDLVDDLARYGRVDVPRLDTEFCRRHLHIFDLVFRLVYEDDPAVRHSLSRWLRLAGTPQVLGIRLPDEVAT